MGGTIDTIREGILLISMPLIGLYSLELLLSIIVIFLFMMSSVILSRVELLFSDLSFSIYLISERIFSFAISTKYLISMFIGWEN